MKKSVKLLLLFTIVGNSYSQKAPVKFGKITMTEMEMAKYELDTSTSAVVLCNYGYFSATSYYFSHTIRVKILKKEGTYYGSWVFPAPEQSTIRGVTLNLENGKIVKEKLTNESIFKERVYEDYYRYRIAMPNVKVGSVIDININYLGLPSEWRFQEKIPVVWSELIIENSEYVRWRKNFFGYEPLYISTNTRWVAKNMPAFKEEPYINSINNFIDKFEIDILDISIPGYYKSYTTSWESVNRYLSDNSYFGGALEGSLYLISLANDLKKKKYETVEEKIKAATEAIKIMKWDETESLFTTNPSLGYTFGKKIGNSADINLMLIQLLRKLDLEAHPVVLSTRENGMISPFFPSLNKLNYVIAAVKTLQKTYLVDATEELLPCYLLPERCLNIQGVLLKIDKEMYELVPLKTANKMKEIIQYDLSMQDDFSLKGKINCVWEDYGAYYFRKKYEEFNSHESYIEDFENKNPGLTVNDSKITGLDSIYNPIHEEYDVTIKNQLTVIDDMIYLNLLLFEQIKENPFKIDERKYPVDFAYPIEQVYQIKFALPENYIIVQKPSVLILKIPDNSAQFLYSVTTLNNTIALTIKFCINKEVFITEEYPDLREFYNQIVTKMAETLVLKMN